MGTAPRKTDSVKNQLEFLPGMDCCNLAYLILKKSRNFVELRIRNRQEFDSKVWSEEFQEEAFLDLDNLAIAIGYLPEDVDFCYAPQIDAGNNYNAYLKTTSKDRKLVLEVFKRSVGVRLKDNYCYFVRTTLFNGTSQTSKNLSFMRAVYKNVLNNLRDGVELREVYHAAQSFAEKRDKDLVHHLEKELGFELCSNFKNESVVIKSDSNAIAKKGMVFALNINLIGLEEGGEPYNLVAVRKDRNPFIFIIYETTNTRIGRRADQAGVPRSS